jgi:hypothetical protein
LATPSGPRGGSAPHGPIAQKKKKFERLAQGGPNHPQWPRGWFGHPLGQMLKFPFGPRGSQTTPWATGGGSAAPKRPVWVWQNHPRPNGVAEPPHRRWPMGWFGHPSIFFYFFFFFWIFFVKKKKKKVMGAF